MTGVQTCALPIYVVITLYDPEATEAGTISLSSNVCVEHGDTGLYFWDLSKITTLPSPRQIGRASCRERV